MFPAYQSVANCRSITPELAQTICASRQLSCRGFVTASHLQRFENVYPARRREHIEMFGLCWKKERRGSRWIFEKRWIHLKPKCRDQRPACNVARVICLRARLVPGLGHNPLPTAANRSWSFCFWSHLTSFTPGTSWSHLTSFTTCGLRDVFPRHATKRHATDHATEEF